MLHDSHVYGTCPVFLNARHREEIRYRYSQFLKGLESLQEIDKQIVSPASFYGRFGEVAFTIANAVFSSEIVAQKNASEIMNIASPWILHDENIFPTT
jgi:hypothetical protein